MKYTHALGLVGVIASCVPPPATTPQGPTGVRTQTVNVVAELPTPKDWQAQGGLHGFHTLGVVLPSLAQAEFTIEGFGMANVLATTAAVAFTPGPTVSLAIPNVPEGRNRRIKVMGKDNQGIPLLGTTVEAIVDIPLTGNAVVNPQTTAASRVYQGLHRMADMSANKSLLSLITNLSARELTKLVEKIVTNQGLTDAEEVDFVAVASQIATDASNKSPDFFFTDFAPLPAEGDFVNLVASGVSIPAFVSAPGTMSHLDTPTVGYALGYYDRSSALIPLAAPPYTNSAQTVTGAFLKPDIPLSLQSINNGALMSRLLRHPTFDANNTVDFHGLGGSVLMRPVKYSPMSAPPGATITVDIDTSVDPGTIGNFFGGTSGEAKAEGTSCLITQWTNSQVKFQIPAGQGPGPTPAVVMTPDKTVIAELFKLVVLSGVPDIFSVRRSGGNVIVEGEPFSENDADNVVSFTPLGGAASYPTSTATVSGGNDTILFPGATPLTKGSTFKVSIGGVFGNLFTFKPEILFYSDRTGNLEVFHMQKDGTAVTNISADGGVDHSPKLSPDGTKVLFYSQRSGNGDIWAMNLDGSNQTNLTNSAGNDNGAVWSPDGTKIAFTSDRNDGTTNQEIYVMNANGTGQTALTTTGAAFSNGVAVWSPDGTKLAFTQWNGTTQEVFVMSASGVGPLQLTSGGDTVKIPVCWTPDGSKIVYHTGGGPDSAEIRSVQPNGTNDISLANSAGSDQAPQFSPDGSKIAFYSNRNGNHDIWVMNPDGSGQTPLTNDATEQIDPQWSPDGTKILFKAYIGDNEVGLINSDGTGYTILTSNAFNDVPFGWVP